MDRYHFDSISYGDPYLRGKDLSDQYYRKNDDYFKGLSSCLNVVKNAWYSKGPIKDTKEEIVGEDKYSIVTFQSGTIVHYKNNIIHREGGEPAIIHSYPNHVNGYKQWLLDNILYAEQGTWEKKPKIVNQKLHQKAQVITQKELKKRQAVKTPSKPSSASSQDSRRISTQKKIITSQQQQKLLQEARSAIQPNNKGIKGLLRKHVQDNQTLLAKKTGFEGYDVYFRSYLICLDEQIHEGKKNIKELKKSVETYQKSFSLTNINQVLSDYQVSVETEAVPLSLNFLRENDLRLLIPNSTDFDEDNLVSRSENIIDQWEELTSDVFMLLEEYLQLPQNCSVGNMKDLQSASLSISQLYNSNSIDEELKSQQEFYDYGCKESKQFRLKSIEGNVKIFFLSENKKALDPVREIWYQELQQTFSLDTIRKLLIQIEDMNRSMLHLQEGLSERKVIFIEHLKEEVLDIQRQFHTQNDDEEGRFKEIKTARQTLNKLL